MPTATQTRKPKATKPDATATTGESRAVVADPAKPEATTAPPTVEANANTLPDAQPQPVEFQPQVAQEPADDSYEIRTIVAVNPTRVVNIEWHDREIGAPQKNWTIERWAEYANDCLQIGHGAQAAATELGRRAAEATYHAGLAFDHIQSELPRGEWVKWQETRGLNRGTVNRAQTVYRIAKKRGGIKALKDYSVYEFLTLHHQPKARKIDAIITDVKSTPILPSPTTTAKTDTPATNSGTPTSPTVASPTTNTNSTTTPQPTPIEPPKSVATIVGLLEPLEAALSTLEAEPSRANQEQLESLEIRLALDIERVKSLRRWGVVVDAPKSADDDFFDDAPTL